MSHHYPAKLARVKKLLAAKFIMSIAARAQITLLRQQKKAIEAIRGIYGKLNLP